MSVLKWWSGSESSPLALKVHPMTATIAAVSSLNWDALDWLESRSLALYHGRTLGHACRAGDLRMVQRVHSRLQTHLADGIGVNEVDLIKWRPVDEDNPFWVASEEGHVHVLDWLVDEGGYVPEWAGGWLYLDAAVFSGNINVCQWWADRFGSNVLSQDSLATTLRIAFELGRIPAIDWITAKDPCLLAADRPTADTDPRSLFLTLVKVCANGHVEVLEWLAAHCEPVLSVACASGGRQLSLMLNAASRHGHIPVLNWLFLNHLPTHFDDQLDVLNLASANGHVHVLNWWVRRYSVDILSHSRSTRAMDVASRNGHIDVLQWWVDVTESDRSLKFSSAALHVPCTRQGFVTLRWWHQQHWRGIATLPKLGTRLVHTLMDHGQVAVLDYLNKLRLVPEDVLDNALDAASYHGHVCVLDWLVQNRPAGKLCYSDRAMLGASERGHVHVLEWWKSRSGLLLKVPSGIEGLSSMNQDVRRWWQSSGLFT